MKTRWKVIIGPFFFIFLDITIKVFKINLTRWFDPKTAILLIFLSSFILEYLVILILDHFKMDPLLIEYLKERIEEKKEIKKHTSTTRRILKLKKIGNKFLFVGLICLGGIVSALYYREGHHQWNGIPLKTLKIFVMSVIISTVNLLIITYSVSGLIRVIF